VYQDTNLASLTYTWFQCKLTYYVPAKTYTTTKHVIVIYIYSYNRYLISSWLWEIILLKHNVHVFVNTLHLKTYIPLIITVRIAGPVVLFPSVTVILRSNPVVVNVEISWSSCMAPAVNTNDNMLNKYVFYLKIT